jgi:FKBP-type peptidyl-prolyl cis-trans isomerase
MTKVSLLLRGCTGILLVSAGLGYAGDEGGDGLHPRVKLETTLGDIVLELDAEKAPITTLNFIRYAEDKYYDGTIFHRVMPNFMIQGGGFTPDVDQKQEGLRDGIKNEWQNGLKNTRGTIAMARLGGRPDSATAQFFINVVDNNSLDMPRDGAGYAVFGKVVEGMDAVDKIRDVETVTHPKYAQKDVVPAEAVVIKSARLVSAFDRTKVEAKVQAEQDKEKAKDAEKTAENADRIKLYEEAKAKGTKSDSGLITYDVTTGDGPAPSRTDRVEVHYTGWLTDGSKFDSSKDRNQPFVFSLQGGVIQGWLEGVGTMKVGGKRILVIPPDLGYGPNARPTIPANSTLVFEVELLGIK